MPEVVLASAEVDALFELIYELRDLPVRARRQRAGPAARPVGLSFGLGGPEHGSAGKLASPRSDDFDLGTQIVKLKDDLVRWDARGEPPPVAPPTRIQSILSAANEDELEGAFLAVFCHQFGADYAGRYEVLVERATALGVYPLIPSSALVEGSAEQALGRENDSSILTAAEPAPLQQQVPFADCGFEGNTSDIALADELLVNVAGTLPEPPPVAEDSGRIGDLSASPTVDEPYPLIVVEGPQFASWAARSKELVKPLTPDSPVSRTTARRVRPSEGGISRPGFWRIFEGRR